MTLHCNCNSKINQCKSGLNRLAAIAPQLLKNLNYKSALIISVFHIKIHEEI